MAQIVVILYSFGWVANNCKDLCGAVEKDWWHTYWTCPELEQSEEEAIIESNCLKSELDENRLGFFNRALVIEAELELDSTYDPLEEHMFNKQPHPERQYQTRAKTEPASLNEFLRKHLKKNRT